MSLLTISAHRSDPFLELWHIWESNASFSRKGPILLAFHLCTWQKPLFHKSLMLVRNSPPQTRFLDLHVLLFWSLGWECCVKVWEKVRFLYMKSLQDHFSKSSLVLPHFWELTRLQTLVWACNAKVQDPFLPVLFSDLHPRTVIFALWSYC